MYAYNAITKRITLVHLWQGGRTLCEASEKAKYPFQTTSHRNGKRICGRCRELFDVALGDALIAECHRQLKDKVYDRSFEELRRVLWYADDARVSTFD